MPLYDYKCGEGHRFERAVPLALFHAVQECDCGAPAQRMISAPRVISDAIEPRFGADGKLHDSLASYRHSLTPEGNPKGERYHELGNDRLPDFKEPPKDRRKMRDAIKRGIEDVKNGRVPPLATGDLTA